jgi:hypothetical protein
MLFVLSGFRSVCCRVVLADTGTMTDKSHLVYFFFRFFLSCWFWLVFAGVGRVGCCMPKGSILKRHMDAGLTETQSQFVREYVKNGGNASAAAVSAGYSKERSRQAGWELSRNQKIIEAVKMEQARYISGELSNVALGTLGNIMKDETAPAAARVQASRWVLEAAGHGLPAAALAARLGMDGADKPLSEFSLADLEEMTKRAAESLDRMRSVNAPTIEAEAMEAQ